MINIQKNNLLSQLVPPVLAVVIVGHVTSYNKA